MHENLVDLANEAELLRVHRRRIRREGVLIFDMVDRQFVAANRESRLVLVVPEVEHEALAAAIFELAPAAPHPCVEKEAAKPGKAIEIGKPIFRNIDAETRGKASH